MPGSSEPAVSVSPSCTVLIAATDRLPTLKARAAEGGGEVLAFTDAETLRALDVIAIRRPDVVSLERLFATTSRGAALISRIKADPRLRGSEVRVVSADGEPLPAPVPPGPAPLSGPIPLVSPAGTEDAIDEQGTRRTPRGSVAEPVDVLIDGNPAALVDLSVAGTQVVSPSVLRPGQRVRVAITDKTTTVRANGKITWATFEIAPESGPRYRAGIEFLGADSALQAFCLKHKA